MFLAYKFATSNKGSVIIAGQLYNYYKTQKKEVGPELRVFFFLFSVELWQPIEQTIMMELKFADKTMTYNYNASANQFAVFQHCTRA